MKVARDHRVKMEQVVGVSPPWPWPPDGATAAPAWGRRRTEPTGELGMPLVVGGIIPLEETARVVQLR